MPLSTNLPLLGAALAMGVLGSTHCVVMCGGVMGVLSAGLTPLRKKEAARAARRQTASVLVAYNLGRVATYSTLGAIAGATGALLARLPGTAEGAIALRLGAGVLLALLGLHLAGLLPHYASVERLGAPLWRRIGPVAQRLLPARSIPAALGLGALWGFLPCGLVMTALGLATTSGTAAEGAATMLAFGLGTVPALVAVGALSAELGAWAKRPWVRRAAGALVLALGVFQVVASEQQWRAAREQQAPSCCHGAVASSPAPEQR